MSLWDSIPFTKNKIKGVSLKLTLESDHFFVELVNDGILNVSRDGDIYNNKTHSYIGYKCGKYSIVSMYSSELKKTLTISVHRLVWLVYEGPLGLTDLVIHLDGDRNKNDIENLKKVTRSTRSSQLKYHYIETKFYNKFKIKLSAEEIVRRIRSDYDNNPVIYKEIADKYNINESEAFKLINRQTFKDVI